MFMLRDGDYKFVYYAGYEPQLFDLKNDPGEMTDLAADPAFAPIRARLEAKLREIADPDELDRRAKAAQAKLLAESGGADVVAAMGDKFAYSPAPEQFRLPAAVPAGVS
jgi:choline-sulfatase